MGGGNGSRRPRRRDPTGSRSPLLLVAGLFGALLAAWSLLVPVHQAPDEAGHDALLFHVVDAGDYPDFDDFVPAAGLIAASLEHLPDHAGVRSVLEDLGLVSPGRGRWLTPDNAVARGDRPTFDELGGRTPWPYRNQLAQHPPGYYAAMSPVAAGVDAALHAQPVERRVLALRWADALLVLPVPLLAAAAARRLGASDPAVLSAALVPLAIPQFAHIGASINNDNLLNLLAATLAVLLAGVVGGDLRARTAVAIGVVAALGLWTKAPAFSFPMWIVVAYALPIAVDRRRRDRLGAAALAVGTTIALGAPWWVRNLVRHGELSPSILDEPGFGSSDDLGPLGWPGLYVGRVTQRFWGSFGSYVASLDRPLVVVLTALVVVAVGAAFVRRRGRGPTAAGVGRVRLAAFAVQVPILAGLMTATALRYYRTTDVPAMMQGRYLFAAMVPLAVVVGVGAARLLGPRAPLAVLAVAAVAHLAGVLAALHGFWAEPDASLRRSFDALVAWSPVPGVVTATVLVLVVAAFVLVAVRLVAIAGRPDGPGPRGGAEGADGRRGTMGRWAPDASTAAPGGAAS